jgi:hypothetical protein
MGDNMSYKKYIDENEKFLNVKPSKVQARNIDIIIFSIFSFAFGFAGGMMPDVEGLMFGIAFLFIVGLFIYHPVKRR